MSETLIIATANTQENRLLKSRDGLKPFIEHGVGVLLMQEVLGLPESLLRERLGNDGFSLAAYSRASGLAIATHDTSDDNLTPKSTDYFAIHEPSKVEKTVKKFMPAGSHRLRERGALLLELATKNNQDIVIVNTHPIIFLRHLARRQQILQLTHKTHESIEPDETLILAGDFNHYPNPQAIDKKMYEMLGLQLVRLEQATWPITHSKHEWLGKVAALATHRQLSSFDAQLDAIVYRGVKELSTKVVNIESDHRAIISEFSV